MMAATKCIDRRDLALVTELIIILIHLFNLMSHYLFGVEIQFHNACLPMLVFDLLTMVAAVVGRLPCKNRNYA